MNTLILLTLSLCASSLSQENDNEDKCKNFLPVVTDYTEEKCKALGEDYYYVKKDNCFKTCEYYEPTDWTSEPCESNADCVPGFQCEDDYCVDSDSVCYKYYIHWEDNPYYDKYWKPKCDENGRWAAKQCKGEVTSGRCFCYDGEGHRLFGQQWVNQAENMTCACSRKKAELLKNETIWYNSFHCDSMGNFEPLQCDSGICWCAESQTGALVSPVVPEAAMKKLPCFHSVTNGNQYLRQCESKKYAQKMIEHKFKQHGTDYANFPTFLCDDDGSYGPYKIQSGIAYCTWRDDSKIMPYQSSVSLHTSDLTCNCARDTKYFAEVGKEQIQLCSSDGEYQFAQSSDIPGQYYCVDADGYKNNAELTTDQDFCKNNAQ